MSVASALKLLEQTSAAITSYDVHLTAEIRFFVTTRRTVRKRIGKFRVQTGKFVDLPPGEVSVRSVVYRQAYQRLGKASQPKRRVEQIDPKSGEVLSVTAFDGKVRRSFHPPKKSGLVGGPPGKDFSWCWLGCDYMEVLGLAYRGRAMVELLTGPQTMLLDPEEDRGLLLVHARPRPEATRIPYDGYRVWLDPEHGMMVKRFEHYQIMPERVLGQYVGGDGKEYVFTRLRVDRFMKIEDGGWVPVEAKVETFQTRGQRAGKKNSEVRISVEAEKSAWNVPLPDRLFTLNFPPGTHVTNMLLGIEIVVGSRAAGENLDRLIAEAKRVVPLKESSIKYAKSWPGRRAGRLTAFGIVLIVTNVALLAGVSLYLLRRLISNRRQGSSEGQ